MIDSYNSYKKAIEFEFNQELLYKNLFKVNGKSVFIPRSFVYKEFFIKYSNLIDLIYWPLILVCILPFKMHFFLLEITIYQIQY
jgi:hypothetical protein